MSKKDERIGEVTLLLQKWTRNIPLVVLGSGASAPHGLPTMWALGEHLKSRISFENNGHIREWQKFVIKLDKTQNLETALLTVTLSAHVIDRIITETWDLVNRQDLAWYKELIEKSPSFPLADLFEYLIGTSSKTIKIITTNYDRLAEYAASRSQAFFSTGYLNNYLGHFSGGIEDTPFKYLRGYRGQVNIWKVHGSLDWYSTGQRHCNLPLAASIPFSYKPSIVTPGKSKFEMTHAEPYRTILNTADTEYAKANGFLCIGYGFNDQHVHPKLIGQIRDNQKPIIVITRQLSPSCIREIIDQDCKNYILIEEFEGNNTRIFCSNYKTPVIIPNKNHWSLNGFMSLIK